MSLPCKSKMQDELRAIMAHAQRSPSLPKTGAFHASVTGYAKPKLPTEKTKAAAVLNFRLQNMRS